MAHEQREPTDSLDRIERQLAMEDALVKKITADTSLSMAQRRELLREIETWMEGDEFGDDYRDWNDDDAFNILVRKLGPRGPLGRLGAAARPESDGA